MADPVTLGLLATTAGGAAGGGGLMAGLGLVSTGLSAFSTIQAGRVEAANLKFQAKQSELQARSAEIQGKEQQNLIREELLKNLSSANAAFAARGISVSSGTPEQARIESIKAAEQSLRAAQLGAGAQAAGARTQAQMFRQDARTARTSSYLQAGATIAQGASRAISLMPSGGGAAGGGSSFPPIPVPNPRRR